MENDYLNMLARIVLPAQILDYFLISGVEQTSKEIYISLDEKMNPELSKDLHFESKGFMAAVSVTDFPIQRPQGNSQDQTQTLDRFTHRQEFQYTN